MSYRKSNIYRDNLCNNYLDLSHSTLTINELYIIIDHLLHLKDLRPWGRANVVDFTDAILVFPNSDEFYITKDMLPSELFKTKINFVFNHRLEYSNVC
ncbi:MAG TPA: hypothetical protein VLG50_05770 [Candidatus Saccharimonadales bacterium]|nr:hypothetical protein [Candidatus Saccharimonadales bacterium]